MELDLFRRLCEPGRPVHLTPGQKAELLDLLDMTIEVVRESPASDDVDRCDHDSCIRARRRARAEYVVDLGLIRQAIERSA